MELRYDHVAMIERALTGAWAVARRDSTGSPRFRSAVFYRDGRFGARSEDGRVRVYGSWSLEPEGLSEVRGVKRGPLSSVPPPPKDAAARAPQAAPAYPPPPPVPQFDDLLDIADASDGADPPAPAEPPVARLVLWFDNGGPPAHYRVTLQDPPLGPMRWEDAESPHVTLLVGRAGAIDAAISGGWTINPNDTTQDGFGLLGLDLRADGQYRMHLSGGVVRVGAWEFDREAALGPRIIDGTLRLDPTEAVFPVETYRTSLREGRQLVLVCEQGTEKLGRLRPDAWARQFVGNWRFVAPAGASVPQEIALRNDGRLEVLVRPGSPRGTGTWSMHSVRRHPNAIEASLAMEIHVIGHATVREQWKVILPLGRSAELFLSSGDGRRTLRYRRLFR